MGKSKEKQFNFLHRHIIMVFSPYTIKKSIHNVGLQLVKLKENFAETIDNQGDPNHVVPDESPKTKIEAIEDKIIKPIPPNEKKNISIVAIDSSSRYLRDPSVNIVLVGLGVISNKEGVKVGPFQIETNYMSIGTFEELLKQLNVDKGIRVKNYVNEYYREDYKIDDIADELRLENENVALKMEKDNHDLIILDGPLYPMPLELQQMQLESEGRKRHQDAYVRLTEERISCLKDNVIGVVKRLETSYKLYKEDKIKEILKVRYPINDAEILNQIKMKYGLRESFLVGPFKLEYSSILLSYTPSRYAYYLLLTNPLGMTSTFRIEGLKLDSLENLLPFIVNRVSQRLIPTYIELADNLSKRASASLLITAYQVLSTMLSINHDDKLTYYQELNSLMSSQQHQRTLLNE